MSDLDAIRERHRPIAFVATTWCIEDVQAWPCDAVRLLGIIGAMSDQPHRLRASEDKWSISHPLRCRDEKGFVRFCEIHDAVEALFEESQAWPEGEHDLDDADVLERYRKERG